MEQSAVNSDQCSTIRNQNSDEKNSVVVKSRYAIRFATRTAVVGNPDQQSSRNTITFQPRRGLDAENRKQQSREGLNRVTKKQ
ncbi:hypothetical protein L1987_33384 [Smallanthus sonchifolius]|uniref:Uncharacterized protein n=1 Tax=Smallanthus sonchifolius TaxID=185202 RepID=A0ACB9HS84_9ASTR|nr:hypothetical protein L1987_33384 [Smallanthus sonchifolius]